MTQRLYKDRLSNLPFVLPTGEEMKRTPKPDVLKLSEISGLEEAHRQAAAAAAPDDLTLDRKSSFDYESGYIRANAVGIQDIGMGLEDPAPLVLRADQFDIVQRRWDQKAINDWQERTFGLKTASVSAIHKKLREEQKELKAEVGALLGENLSLAELESLIKNIGVEIADNIIVLMQLAGRLGIDIQDNIDQKMEKNVRRQWNVNSDGTGQHVKGT